MTRRLTSVVLAVAVVVAGVTPVVAQDEDLRSDLAQVRERISKLATEIDTASGTRTEMASQVLATESRMDAMLAELGAVQAELAVVQDDLRDQQIRLLDVRHALDEVRNHLEETRNDLAQREDDASTWARELYMGAGQERVAFAVGASDVSEIALGLEYLNRMSVVTDRVILELESLQVQEQSQIERVGQREQELAQEVRSIVEIETELAVVEDELNAQRAVIADELDLQRSLLGEIDAELALFEGELANLETEQNRIEEAIRAEQATLTTGGGGGGGGDGVSTGVFVRPVPGGIGSGFGPRRHPILGYTRMHTGVDMSAGFGEEIRAADGGTVIIAGSRGGYGTTVVIDHGGGVSTLYAHQSRLGVSYGQQVGRGDVIGYIGSTGLSTGPHLHFEVRINGSPVDPAPYL